MKRIAALVMAMALLAAPAWAGSRVKFQKVLDNVLVSGTAGDSYVTQPGYLDLAFSNEETEGYFSLFVTTSSAGGTPHVAVRYIGAVDPSLASNFVAPRDSAGAALSDLIADTNTAGEGLALWTNVSVRLMPYIKFVVSGTTGNPADTYVTLWAVKH